ncbi:hypothetical protein B296_00026495 [Ensete ventricosum]|uniref:Uncharacterized protein n=1 Tax=Ensete ventricosum TaxID=4639 RepID=A0A427AKU4_ENSVE|nr:hypothetical protein B296_00026495 [Ensete ventricosum]
MRHRTPLSTRLPLRVRKSATSLFEIAADLLSGRKRGVVTASSHGRPSGELHRLDARSLLYPNGRVSGEEQSQEVGGIDGVPWQVLRLRHGPERGGGGPEKRAVDPGGGPRSDELCGGSWRGAMELSRPLLGYVAHLL